MIAHLNLSRVGLLTVAALAMPTILFGCGGGGGGGGTTIQSLTPITVTPPSVSLHLNSSQQFQTSAAGTPTWSVQESAGCGSIDQQGNYLAPAAVPTGDCHVAVSATGTTTAVAKITITDSTIHVSVLPNKVALTSGQSQTFTATVTGATNTKVTWSVQEGSAGGSITADGVYTAPTTLGVYHVIATSQADNSVSGYGTVTVKAANLGVQVK